MKKSASLDTYHHYLTVHLPPTTHLLEQQFHGDKVSHATVLTQRPENERPSKISPKRRHILRTQSNTNDKSSLQSIRNNNQQLDTVCETQYMQVSQADKCPGGQIHIPCVYDLQYYQYQEVGTEIALIKSILHNYRMFLRRIAKDNFDTAQLSLFHCITMFLCQTIDLSPEHTKALFLHFNSIPPDEKTIHHVHQNIHETLQTNQRTNVIHHVSSQRTHNKLHVQMRQNVGLLQRSNKNSLQQQKN